MTGSQKKQFGIVLALTLVALIVSATTFFKNPPDWWPNKPIRLGLELKGGTHLILGVQTEEAVKNQLTAIAGSVRGELRRERAGIIQARPIGNRELQVTLLGDQDLSKLEEYIRENYRFLTRTNTELSGRRITVTYEMQEAEAAEIERNAVVQAIETIRNRVDQYGVADPTIQHADENRVMVQLPDITNLDTLKATIGSVGKLEFRLVADANRPKDETVNLRTREGGRLRVEEEVLMTEDAIKSANVNINPQNLEIEVTLHLNPFGRQAFGRITSDCVGRQLAIVIDDVVQSYSVISKPILGGTVQISGGFTRVEAHRLAVVLRSGALPAPLNFEEERTIDATLGADSIRKWVISLLLGSLAVVVIFVFYYRRAGVYLNLFEKLGRCNDRTLLWIGLGLMAIPGVLLITAAGYFVRAFSGLVNTETALPFSSAQLVLLILLPITAVLVSSIIALHISSRLSSIPSPSWSRATFLIGLGYLGLIVLNLALPDRPSSQFVILLLFAWLAIWLSLLKATYELSYPKLAGVFVLFVVFFAVFQAAIGYSMFAFVIQPNL